MQNKFISIGVSIFFCLLVLLSLYITGSISMSADQFAVMYEKMGRTISDSARMGLSYHFLGMVLPLFAFFACIYFSAVNKPIFSKNYYYVFVIVTFLFAMAWNVFFIEAVYQPVLMRAR